MEDDIRHKLGVAEAEQAADDIQIAEDALPKPPPPNRAERRDMIRKLRKLTRPARSMKRLRHPLTKKLTPYGAKQVAKRRAARKAAK